MSNESTEERRAVTARTTRRALVVSALGILVAGGLGVALMLMRRSAAPPVPEGFVPVTAAELRAPIATLDQELVTRRGGLTPSEVKEFASLTWPELTVRTPEVLSGPRMPPLLLVNDATRGGDEEHDYARLSFAWAFDASDLQQLRRSQVFMRDLARTKQAFVYDLVTDQTQDAAAFERARVTGWAKDAPPPLETFLRVAAEANRVRTHGMRAFGLPDLVTPNAANAEPLLRATAQALVANATPDEHGTVSTAQGPAQLLRDASAPKGPELELALVLPAHK